MDRYVNGGNVPYPILRKVWAETVGWDPPVSSLGAINVYATIREVNMTLPPDHRIKVWLGDPPVDWSAIKSEKDLESLEAQRDSYPAQLIDREILARNKKALVIYGADHLRLGALANQNNLLGLVKKAHPDAFFMVWPYLGYTSSACAAPFEGHISNWPGAALIGPLRGSAWEPDVFKPGCGPFPPAPKLTQEQNDGLMRDYVGLTSDALLYLGPRDRLTLSPLIPDLYLDQDYRAEMERRRRLRGGKQIGGHSAADNPAAPRPFFPN